MSNHDDTKIGKMDPPIAERRTAELRIALTENELKFLDAVAGGNTDAWARLTLLAAAKRHAKSASDQNKGRRKA